MNYLYNGVELQALPEWDKEAYPYAMLFDSSNPYFEAFDSEPYKTDFDLLGFRQDGKCVTAFIDDGADSWGELREGTYSVGGTTLGFPFWANFNIRDDDGTIHLAASDPVPVADARKSFLQGWLVGRRLRK